MRRHRGGGTPSSLFRTIKGLMGGNPVTRADIQMLQQLSRRQAESPTRTKAKGGRGAFVAMRSYTKAGYPIEGRRRKR